MTTTAPTPSSRAHWWIFLGLLLAYTLIFFYYYPPLPGIEDEAGFINQAILWSKGAVTAESAGVQTRWDFTTVGGQHVSWRNPGRSLLILPLYTLLGFKAIFASGALIHFLMALAAARLFDRLGHSPLWAVLILLHPTLTLYSRTVMGDTPAALFITLALLALTAKRCPGLLAGLAIGLAAAMRYQSGMLLPLFALSILACPLITNRKREAVFCLLGGGAIGIGIAIYNKLIFGNLVGFTGQGYFGAEFVKPHLIFYITALLLLWPLMLLAPIFDRSPLRWPLLAIFAPIILLFIPYYFHDRGPSFIQTVVQGQRLIQPALPALIICYALVVARLIVPRLTRIAPQPVFAGMAAACIAAQLIFTSFMFAKHQQHLKRLDAARTEFLSLIPPDRLVVANSTLSKLFAVAHDERGYTFLSYDLSGKPLDNTARLQRASNSDWYLALLPKGAEPPQPQALQQYIETYKLERIPTKSALMLWAYKPQRDEGTLPAAKSK